MSRTLTAGAAYRAIYMTLWRMSERHSRSVPAGVAINDNGKNDFHGGGYER